MTNGDKQTAATLINNTKIPCNKVLYKEDYKKFHIPKEGMILLEVNASG
jgi:hypothetical protein